MTRTCASRLVDATLFPFGNWRNPDRDRLTDFFDELESGGKMQTGAYSAFRSNLRSCIDEVVNDSTPLVVTSNNPSANVVVMSESDYENLVENFFIISNEELVGRLRKSSEQFRSGSTLIHDVADDDD